MAKILVTPVGGCFPPFELEGRLTSRHSDNEGLIYYIKGQSFPEQIVTILEGESEAESA